MVVALAADDFGRQTPFQVMAQIVDISQSCTADWLLPDDPERQRCGENSY